MTTLDWLILLFVLILGLFGLRQGFIVGVLSFGGFAIGAFIGTRVGPLLLPQGSASPYAPAFGLVGALLAGAILATGLEGVGWRLRRTTLLVPGVGLLDRTFSALLSAAVGLGVVWIVAAVAAQIPTATQLRADIQRSVILGELNVLLPPSGPILNALARLDPIPSLPGPLPALTAPSPRIAHDPVVLAASRSVVRVLGTACGLAIEGSGWVARPEEVITNAHVVAGESDTVVQIGGIAPGLPARTVVFDPHDDIAVLRVPGLNEPTLNLERNPRSGTAAGILGYPLDGPFNAQPGRIGQTQVVNTQDAYGNGPVQRSITSLRGRVRPGNSGGPMIDAAGRVVATVFAAITGSSGSSRGGFAVPNTLVRAQLDVARSRSTAVSTQGCAG